MVVASAAAALTRLTWPFFAGAPFAPLFGAVALTTHFGGAAAGLLTIVLAVAGSWLAFPSTGVHPWNPYTVIGFIPVALLGNRIIAGRNRAVAALRASEAELRARLAAQRQAEIELRASEEKLRRAQKMEAVGQLVAGVAHNFNNLLTVTLGYADVLLERHAGDPEDREDLQEIRKATERGAILTRQLLAFGRKHDPHPARIDLNRTIAGLREVLTRVIREDIQLTTEIDAAPATVLIDPHDLEQVVFNLVINARDALPLGGTIRVDVARERIDAANAPPDMTVTPGEYVRLRVRDDGIGMTPDVQSHLFEPFFTTKEVGEGTGLGLAFVHGIAQHGRGFVTITSAPGKGTTVSVYLPPVEAPAAAVTAPQAAAPSVGRPGATILLVEDEAPVRNMTAQVLTRAGYRVLSAATPAEACDLFDRHASDIDLLLTDVVMPDMHGPVLAERLLAGRPGLPVLFVSGYSDAMPDTAAPAARTAFLAKPFASSRLVTAVGDLLIATTN